MMSIITENTFNFFPDIDSHTCMQYIQINETVWIIG